MDAVDQRIIAQLYVEKESFQDAYPLVYLFKASGAQSNLYHHRWGAFYHASYETYLARG